MVHLHNYLLAESPRRPFVCRFITACALALFFNFISKLLFKTSLASFFLSRCLPPVLFVRIFSLQLFYRHSLFLRVPPIRPRLTPFPLRYRLCRLKISSGSNCNRPDFKRIRLNSCEPKMESGQRVN